MFVLMGLILERTGIAEDTLIALGRLFRKQPGGLLVAMMSDVAVVSVDTQEVSPPALEIFRTCALRAVDEARALALHDGALVTVACSEGDTGYVFDGLLDYDREGNFVPMLAEALPEAPLRAVLEVPDPRTPGADRAALRTQVFAALDHSELVH